MPLNLNSVIDVGYEKADREKVLRRVFLCPGSHDKITDCLLPRWSANASRVITKSGRALCRARTPADGPFSLIYTCRVCVAGKAF